MNELLEKIRSRGYWKVIIRPATFVEKRISNTSDLYPILEKTSVQVRIWGFPHLDNNEKLGINVDWIGQEIAWEYYLELWRFYQSGQFVHLSGMAEDWLDRSRLSPPDQSWKPRTFLNVVGVVFRFTEIFEFAARLAFTAAGDEQMRLEITLSGLEGRTLWVDPSYRWGASLLMTQKASVKELPYKTDLARTQLVTEPSARSG